MSKIGMNRTVMNRMLQHWVDKPGWQLYLWLWGLLGIIGVMAYGVMLRPEWAEHGRFTDEIAQQQQSINNQQSRLMQLPSLSSLRDQSNVLLQKESLHEGWLSAEGEKQPFDSALAHQVGEWIMPFGGQVVRWQRVVEPTDTGNYQLLPGQNKPLPEQKEYFPEHKKQWDTTLRINFHGALHLLRQLTLSPSPILIKIIEINRENRALTIKLNLKEYRAEGKHE